MGVHDVGQEPGDVAEGDVDGGAAERAEAAPVVGMVGAGAVAVGAAGPVVERGAVEDDQRQPGDLGREQPGRHAEQRRIVVDDAGVSPSFSITCG